MAGREVVMSKKGRHKSVEKNLRRSVKWLESREKVTRVILGLTDNCRHSYSAGAIRHRRDVPGGFKANGYGGCVIIDMFIGVEPEDLEDVKKEIKEKFGE
jgi:hypothetical protein